jgi:hypothetical protein
MVHAALCEAEGGLRGGNQIGGGGLEKRNRRAMKAGLVILIFALAAAGCTTSSSARLKAQNAYLAGQNAALQRQPAGVTVVGAVQNPQVPWVTGLTLAQAIATANYTGADAPKQILITRQGETAAMDAKVLLDGTDIPLEVGDVVGLR